MFEINKSFKKDNNNKSTFLKAYNFNLCKIN